MHLLVVYGVPIQIWVVDGSKSIHMSSQFVGQLDMVADLVGHADSVH